MEKIEKELKHVSCILINSDGLSVVYGDGKGRNIQWMVEDIFAKDFKITGNQYGDRAGVIKFEIG